MSTVIGQMVLLVDASCGSEVYTSGFEITHDMPEHMQKVLARNAKKGMCSYENVRFESGVDELDGLVDDEWDSLARDAEEAQVLFGWRVGEVERYIHDAIRASSASRRSVIGMKVDFIITLAPDI